MKSEAFENSEFFTPENYVDLLKQIHLETVQWNFYSQYMLEELLELGYCYLPKPNVFSENPVLTQLGLKAIGLAKNE